MYVHEFKRGSIKKLGETSDRYKCVRCVVEEIMKNDRWYGVGEYSFKTGSELQGSCLWLRRNVCDACLKRSFEAFTKVPKLSLVTTLEYNLRLSLKI